MICICSCLGAMIFYINNSLLQVFVISTYFLVSSLLLCESCGTQKYQSVVKSFKAVICDDLTVAIPAQLLADSTRQYPPI